MRKLYLFGLLFAVGIIVFAAGCIGGKTSTTTTSTSNPPLVTITPITSTTSTPQVQETETTTTTTTASSVTTTSTTPTTTSTTTTSSTSTEPTTTLVPLSFDFGKTYVLYNYNEYQSFSYRNEVTFVITWNTKTTQTVVLAYPGDTFVVTKTVNGLDYMYYITSYQYYDHTLTTKVKFFDANKLTQGVYVVINGQTSTCTECAASLPSIMPETVVIPSFSNVSTSDGWKYASTVLTTTFQSKPYTYTVYYSIKDNTLIVRVINYVYDLYDKIVAFTTTVR